MLRSREIYAPSVSGMCAPLFPVNWLGRGGGGGGGGGYAKGCSADHAIVWSMARGCAGVWRPRFFAERGPRRARLRLACTRGPLHAPRDWGLYHPVHRVSGGGSGGGGDWVAGIYGAYNEPRRCPYKDAYGAYKEPRRCRTGRLWLTGAHIRTPIYMAHIRSRDASVTRHNLRVFHHAYGSYKDPPPTEEEGDGSYKDPRRRSVAACAGAAGTWAPMAHRREGH